MVAKHSSFLKAIGAHPGTLLITQAETIDYSTGKYTGSQLVAKPVESACSGYRKTLDCCKVFIPGN